jgi:hypothetical protein
MFAQDNMIIEVSGRVTDQEKQLPLPDVSVQVKGTIAGTITNSSAALFCVQRPNCLLHWCFHLSAFNPRN